MSKCVVAKYVEDCKKWNKMDYKMFERETRPMNLWKRRKSLKIGLLPLEIRSSWKGV